jgi:putative transposase
MDFDHVDPRRWETARHRAEILSKLPERPSGAQLRDAMAALGVGRTTLFRWLMQFRVGARTSALLPRRRSPNSGMRRMMPEALTIVDRHFREFYATRRRPTVTRFRAEIAVDLRPWPRATR